MLGRWLHVRIRTAERALAEGRVDEAYTRALEPEFRREKRGKSLLDALGRALLARARVHAQAGRYREAIEDLDKLAAIDRSDAEAQALRTRIREEWRRRDRNQAEREAEVRRAAERVQAGRLESGRLEVERVSDPLQREELREQLDVRAQRSAQILAQARELLEREDVGGALRTWQEAVERHGSSGESDEVAAALVDAVHTAAGRWLAQGRLERVLALRTGLERLRRVDPSLDHVERMAALCGRAAAQLGSRDFRGLRETLVRLRSGQADSAWIHEAVQALDTINDAQDRLMSSPLGLFATAAHAERELPARSDAETRAAPTGPAAPQSAGGALLMLVDGAGSALLLRTHRVRIGRAGGRAAVDVPLPADVRSHHADIERQGEDYFLIAHGAASVNRRPVRRALLRDGDRIVLGTKAKLVFRRPSVKSETAALNLSHRCRLAQDVGQIIMLQDTCLIGPRSSSHVVTPEGDTQVVLFERGGRLWAREATAGGGKLGDARRVLPGETHEFSDVRVTFKEYETS